jgi:NhaP-type Na+/H+ or K+/H+ antiporter
MLPVFFALTGLRANSESKLFVGWFGPRGLASIVFAVIVVNANLPNGGILATTVACTIIFSIILHGISANPWAKGFGERSRSAQSGADAGDS